MFIKGRLNRREYDAMLPAPRRKKTFAEAMGLVRRIMKRAAIAAGHIEDPATKRPKWDWHWHNVEGWKPGDMFGQGGIVQANTKGEARAFIKKELGINKNHRLWPVTIVRVTPATWFADAATPDFTFPDGRLANAG